MTAIAAVIAFSSSPLFAQIVADEPLAETPAPVVETTPAPVADDPLAPAPTADTAPAADPLAAAPAEKPAARKATTATTPAARTRPAPARAASSAPAVTAAPTAVTMAPVAAAPVEPLPTQLEVPPVEAPIEQPPAAADAIQMDETMLAAGAGGLALLALAGTGLAIRRRRRRAADAEDAAWQEQVQALPDPVAEPAMAVEVEPVREPTPGYMPEQGEPAFVRAFAPALTPLPVAKTAPEPSAELEGPVTELPEGFDLSRFSPNMQAAYKGPTEDNPSLSLKHRLRRASGMDQLEEREADPTSPVEAPADKPVVARPTKADFMLGSASQKANVKPSVKTSVRPVYTN